MPKSPDQDAELFDLVDALYDCAIRPEGWSEALHKIAEMMNGDAAGISLHSPAESLVRLTAHWNVDDDLMRAMEENIAINPAIPAPWYYDVDQPFTAFEFVGKEELRSSVWYKNTIGPRGYDDAVLTLIAKSPREFGGLTVMRRSDRPAFTADDVEKMRLIAPHVRRAVTIANLLDSRTLHRDTMSSILDMLAVATVLVDASANIMDANASALRYFEEGTALLRDGEKLSANSERCNHDLRLAITEAAAAGEVRVPKTGLSVVLKGTDDRDLAAWVLPLGSGLRLSLGAPYAAQAAVFVRELGSTSPFPAELFVRHYGVTPDECRLLMALVQGMTLKDAADTLGIAHATAKSHLARLFQKTGSERQADLVRLAMTALAPATA